MLREGNEDLAHIKAEDVIQNDNLIIALEILELHCERLVVRAIILDHLAFGDRHGSNARNSANIVTRGPRNKDRERSRGRVTTIRRQASSQGRGQGEQRSTGSGWELWKMLGLSSERPKERDQHAEQSNAVSNGGGRDDGNINEPVSTKEDGREEKDIYIDPELDRAAAVVFYAYHRIPRDIPGLSDLRLKLLHRWGNEFMLRAQEAEPGIIDLPEGLTNRLRIDKPPDTLIEGYLREISRSHKILYRQDPIEALSNTKEDTREAAQDQKSAQPLEAHEISSSEPQPQNAATANTAVNNAVANMSAAKTKARSPTAGVPKNPVLDSPELEQDWVPESKKTGGIPEMDELAKRFSALKRN